MQEEFVIRRHIVFLMVAFMSILCYGYVHSIESGRYIEKIKNRGTLVVGMVAKDQFPFFFVNDVNELVGLDVDIAMTIANLLDVNLEIDRSAKSFNDLIPLVDSGVIDLAISKLSRTLGRSQTVLYSSPYLVFRQALLLNRVQIAKVSSNDGELVSVLRNFSGKLGVIKNSSYERYARANFPLAEIVSFDTWGDALDALSRSELIGVYRDEMEIEVYTRTHPEQNLYLRPIIIKDQQDPIAVAMHSSAVHFMRFINLFFQSRGDVFPKNVKDLLEKYEVK